MSRRPYPIRAVLFDTFGTVVDWRGGMLAAVSAWGRAQGVTADWGAFIDQWRTCENPGKQSVSSGATPWKNLKQIHAEALDPLLRDFGLAGLSPAQRAWLLESWSLGQPWPDTLPGLTAIRARLPIASLSNGSVSQMVKLARHAGLPWDCILSSEMFRAYKPAQQVYLGACRYLDLAPREVMLCAAHNYDLRAADSFGLATAFIPRPTEFGPAQIQDFTPEGEWTYLAADLVDLGRQIESDQ
jgi:2-haloacid dehalogenase